MIKGKQMSYYLKPEDKYLEKDVEKFITKQKRIQIGYSQAKFIVEAIRTKLEDAKKCDK